MDELSSLGKTFPELLLVPPASGGGNQTLLTSFLCFKSQGFYLLLARGTSCPPLNRSQLSASPTTEHWCPSCSLQQTLTSLAVNAMLLLIEPSVIDVFS